MMAGHIQQYLCKGSESFFSELQLVIEPLEDIKVTNLLGRQSVLLFLFQFVRELQMMHSRQ